MEKITSVFIYIITFFLSVFFLNCAKMIHNSSKNLKVKNHYRQGKAIEIILLMIGIIIPCLLAAFRADSVGADTQGYAVRGFRNLQNYTSIDKVFAYDEWLFYFIGYIISKFTDNVSWFLGAIHFFIIAPVVCVAWKMKNKLSFTYFVLLFYFRFYNYSLCIMRQSIACSFLLLSYIYYKEKKMKSAIILAVISTFIHSTAILGICFMIAAILFERLVKWKQWRFVNIFIILIFFGIIGIFAERVLQLLLQFNLIPAKYNALVRIFAMQSNRFLSDFSMCECFFRMIFIFIILFIYRKRNRYTYDNNTNGIAYLSIIGNELYILIAVLFHTGTGYRLTEYLDYFNLYYMATISNEVKITIGKYNIMKYLILALFVAYWLIVFILFPEGMGMATEIYKFRF